MHHTNAILAASAILALVVSGPAEMLVASGRQAPAAAAQKLTPQELDILLGPIALYPDQLLAQMMLASATPAKVGELDKWLKANTAITGTDRQKAVEAKGFSSSLVLLSLFPQVVAYMAEDLVWTGQLGQAFATDRSGVMDSVQRLRAKASAAGTLKDTPQQNVETRTTKSGDQVIVIEPANQQVVYVPQYNAQTVYTQPATTTTTVVVQEDDDDDDAAAAVAGAAVGMAAGIAIGAAFDNDYYYGPYGWHGGAYMYNDAWDDYYDHREDAREDWADHREDMYEDRSDRLEDTADERAQRRSDTQQQRTERTTQRSTERTERTTARQGGTTSGTQASTAATQASTARQSGTTATQASRGYGDGQRATPERSGTRSDAFSGYSSGKSERAASSRGNRSRSSSGGGGRSRSGGGRRR
jgi:hypothetical protein